MIWRLIYCNKDGVEARLDIIRGGATPVETIEGTATPFILNYKMDKSDKSGHVMSSSADISIFETPTFNIDNLKTSSETEIKVEHYINGVLDWSGFVIPDFFSKTIGTPATVEMVASDRLGTLKGVTLSGLAQYESMRDLAVACLAKTGLTLPLYTMADFGNAGQTNAFFKALGLSGRLSDTKGRNISCYNILKSILVASDSKLVQQSGAWYIVNKFQHEQGAGNLFSTLTASTAYSEQTVSFSDVHVGARRTIIPVAATTGVFHEFGGGKEHPENFDFSMGVSGWTNVNGFTATTRSEEVVGYELIGGVYKPIYGGYTSINHLVNLNPAPLSDPTSPRYIKSADIPSPIEGAGSLKITASINATAYKAYPNMPVYVWYTVIAKKDGEVLALDLSGVFVPYVENQSVLERVLHKLSFKPGFTTVDFKAEVDTNSDIITGELAADELSDYTFEVRIYGSGSGSITLINFFSLNISSIKEQPRGSIFKRIQGTGFTKEHDIDTTIFGDYISRGLDGYFYTYAVDDTSSLYSSEGTLTEPLWTAHGDTEQLPLLRHVTRQKSRMFSVAHNMISARVDVATFKPLSIFIDCNSVRHVVISASYDFLRSEVEVELEQIAYATLDVREYIYSYFGDGESGVKSIGGISSGTGGGGSGGGMTADQVAILSEVQVLAHDHGNKEVLDQVTQDVVDNALREMIISTDTETELTDENYLSSLRVLKEILDNNEYLRTQFLSKVNPDTAKEIIKFVKGIEIGTFTTGPLGAGAAIKMENGVSRMEVDQLDVRMRATFRELIIESLKHIGGQLILSPARMKCTSVIDGGTYYKCYFDTGDGKVSNEFVAGDQARCQVFTGSGVKMYWRLVTSVGTDWINLSKTDAISGSSIPEAGDDIVQLGNRSDATRQNAQILSTVGADAPSWKQYKGINAFSLEGKDTTVFSGTGNKIDGKTVFMSSGANVEDGINSKNSNYSSQPTSYKANDTWTLSSDTTVNGIAYKSGEILTATQDSTTFVQAHWVKKVRYTDDTAVNDLQIGGRNYIIKSQLSNTFFSALDGNLSTSANVLGSQKQLFESDKLTVNDFTGLFKMTINYYDINEIFLTSTYIQNGNTYIETFPLTTTVPTGTKFISYTIVKKSGGTFPPSESNTLKLKLEKGSKATDWTEAPEDVQAAIDAEKTRINEILSDNIADPSEKQYLSNLWQEIYAEYPRIWAQADTYAVDKSNYEAKYSALNTLLSPVLADLTVNSTVSGASIRTAFSQYYDARTFLLNNITNKVNTTAADAQAKANTAKAVTDKFGTTTEGGLISTVITEYRELNSEQVTGLISGIQGTNKDLPFLVAGGTYNDALSGTAKAIIRHDGSVKFTDGEFSGTINATSGAIGGFEIGYTRLGAVADKHSSTGEGLALFDDFIKFSRLIADADGGSVPEDSYVWVGIGENVFPASSGSRGLARFENHEQQGQYVPEQRTYYSYSAYQSAGSPTPATFYYYVYDDEYESTGHNWSSSTYYTDEQINNHDYPFIYGGYFIRIEAQVPVWYPLYTNYGVIIDVKGAAENIALDIFSGVIAGLAIRTRQISSGTTLTRQDVYVSCYNTSTITVYLPPNPQTGKIIFVHRVNEAGITVNGNGKTIQWGSGSGSSINTGGGNGRGDTGVYVFDGQYWMYNYLIRKPS